MGLIELCHIGLFRPKRLECGADVAGNPAGHPAVTAEPMEDLREAVAPDNTKKKALQGYPNLETMVHPRGSQDST